MATFTAALPGAASSGALVSLADRMKVTGASVDNGLLSVDVVREVPEAAKPRTIKICFAVARPRPQVTEQKAA